MAIALVQTSAELLVSSGTTGSVTLNGVAAGNLLVALAGQETNASTLSFSDGVNTWSSAINRGTVSIGIAAAGYAKNVAGGNTTITVTCSGAATFRARVFEVSGTTTATPLQSVDSIVETVGTTSHATTDGIVSQSDCIIFCVAEFSNGPGVYTPGAGYTQVSSAGSFTRYQYGILVGAQTLRTVDFTSGNSQACAVVAMAFGVAPAAASGGLLTHPGMLGRISA